MIDSTILIPMLAAVAAMLIGGAILLARWARRVPMQERLRKLEQDGGADAIILDGSNSGSRWQNILAGVGGVIAKGGGSVSLQQEMSQAGYHNPKAASGYLGAKMILLFAGLLVLFAIPNSVRPMTRPIIAGMVSGMLFFIPNIHIMSRRQARRGEIRRHLPDAIDLLEICSSSGMGLDQAWNSVAEEVRGVSPTLADEMALTNLEMHLGAPRAVAMRHMAARTGADELSSLVAVLVQSERFGTSIRDALRTYAQSMRETRSQYAQESAEKMAVKLIFPMVAFIFPAVVMVMAGPGFMMLYKALRAG